MRIVLAVCLLFAFIFCKAKTEFTPQLAKAYTYLFKLKLDSTQILINKSVRSEPDNHVGTLLYCYVEFIRILLSEDRFVYTQWQNRFEFRINSVKMLDDKSPYRNYILGEMYIQSSLLKVKFNDGMGALLDFRKGYGYLADNEKDFPEFLYHKKTLGTIHILLSFIPNKYKWVIRLIGFSTDFDIGQAQLQVASKDEVATKDEAIFIQMWLKIAMDDKNEEGVKVMKDFIATHPDYIVAKWSLIMILKNMNKVDEALAIADQIKPSSGFYYSPYFYFVKGQMNLYTAEFERAKQELDLFLANYKGVMLRQSAFYFKYLADYVNGQEGNLSLLKDSVLLTGKSGSEQDRIAQSALTENPNPNIELVKARLYFDGGRYQSSLNELLKLKIENINTENEKVEYYYRVARAYEKLSDLQNAFVFYKLTIEKQKQIPLYFAPNAYLLMARLVKATDKNLAKQYLKKVDDFNNYEYQTEIEYQAKALLKKL